MASVTEHLELLQKLTQQNFDILKSLNDAFFTKLDYLNVNIDNSKYVIPSFMSLENKLNYLQENFNNLVLAPENGEAYFDFDGNTRAIEVRGYTLAPNSLTLPEVSEFNVETNNIFKDFLTPNPYIHFDISSIPNDLTSVVVKKIIPRNNKLIELFRSNLINIKTNSNGDTIQENISSKQYAYKDLYKILFGYKKDIDYIEYDKIIKLPIRKTLGTGTYVIEKIELDITDENLDQFITFKLRNNLKNSEYVNGLYYRVFDDTIEKTLLLGDEITTYDGKAKMIITELRPNTNSMVVKIVNGEYLNLIGCDDVEELYITESSKLKFHSAINFSDDKYINIPLEEDQYIFIAIAPLNDRMNIRAPWGNGLMLDTFILQYAEANENTVNKSFKDYYYNNIKNIGDVLNEISSMSYSTITKYTKEQFNILTQSKPILNPKDLLVIQINNHLNDSKTILEIRSLYSLKLKYNTELTEVLTNIDNYNKLLQETSFDDVIDTRASITAQLSALNKRKNELVTSITKVINDIALTANNSEIPIEDAKYRIRGYFNYKKFLTDNNLNITNDHIKGIKVQYRYKNPTRPQGSSLSINGEFLFSDWNDMKFLPRDKFPTYEDDVYKFKSQDDNSNLNEPSFNQIDIPITQGESVDIRLKVLYDFGYPFIQTTTIWSDILNIPFPKELLKNVLITTIIEENNNDIETNRFNNILLEEGIPQHVLDKITDQDITYFHKPENISSGFYTAERRIIPLKDKLTEFDMNIATLLNEINGDTAGGLVATAEIGGRSEKLQSYQMNNISVAAYDNFISKYLKTGLIAEGGYSIDQDKISVIINIKLTNTANKLLKIYSMFPGDRSIDINRLRYTKFDKKDYTYNSEHGVWMKDLADRSIYRKDDPKYKEKVLLTDKKIQTANQFVTFRILNASSGQRYYFTDDPNELFRKSDKQTADYHIELPTNTLGAALYPYLPNSNALNIESDAAYSCLSLSQGESVSIPLIFEYNLSNNNLPIISKVVTFDVRTSLYSEPINYAIKVTAKKSNTLLDRITITDKRFGVTKYNTVIAN